MKAQKPRERAGNGQGGPPAGESLARTAESFSVGKQPFRFADRLFRVGSEKPGGRNALPSFAPQSNLAASQSFAHDGRADKPSNHNNNMVPSYIPPQLAACDAWLTNLDTLLTAAPATYGITAPTAALVAAQQVLFHAAFLLSTTPATRTPVTVQATVDARATMEGVVRPICQQIANNPAVDPSDKIALGLNLPNNVPVPVPTPTIVPTVSLVRIDPLQATLDIRNPETPTSKKKPLGVIGIQIFTAVGVAAVSDPAQCALAAVWTKNPNILGFVAGDRTKYCTVFARFTTRGGQGGQALVGPWSLPLVFVVS